MSRILFVTSTNTRHKVSINYVECDGDEIFLLHLVLTIINGILSGTRFIKYISARVAKSSIYYYEYYSVVWKVRYIP